MCISIRNPFVLSNNTVGIKLSVIHSYQFSATHDEVDCVFITKSAMYAVVSIQNVLWV